MKKLSLDPLATLTTPILKQGDTVSMSNPASVYCESIGGKSEVVKNSKGWYGVCHLPDGTIVDEWDLYRANHK